MKLSKETINIMKNFSSINTNLIILPGNKLSTLSQEETLLAYAEVEENFTDEFAIYDLSEFLSAMSLFEDPDVEFKNGVAKIKQGSYSIKYIGAEKSILKLPKLDGNTPTTLEKFPTDLCEIKLPFTADVINNIMKSASVLKSPDVTIRGDGDKVTIIMSDKKNPSSNAFEFPIGETDMVFSAYIKINNLRLIPGDYDMYISSKKVCRVEHKDRELIYFIGLESDSSFDL